MEIRIVAKIKCASAVKNEFGGEQVKLSAVYSDDPENPNHSWSQATPSGQVDLLITNPGAQGFFVEGEEYLIEFRKAGEEKVDVPATETAEAPGE